MRIYDDKERDSWRRSLALRSGQRLTWNAKARSSGLFDGVGDVTFVKIKRVADEYGAEFVGDYDVVYDQDEMGNLANSDGHIICYKTRRGIIKSCAFSFFEESE
ncbi:MAG: hypothetical protein V4582_16505 [Pseudomonadota bacterium]